MGGVAAVQIQEKAWGSRKKGNKGERLFFPRSSTSKRNESKFRCMELDRGWG